MPSVMQRIGTPNSRHNLDNNYRKHLENVNPELSEYNEIIRQKSVESIYAEHLQPSFEAFNDKQRRKDRRLDVKWDCRDALGYQRALDKAAKESKNQKLRESGRPPIREIVWQFGNPEQGYGSAGQTIESREKIKGMLLEVQAAAEARYPQFVWGDLVFHADEESLDADEKEMGSLHLHSSFVPLCFENKQGMDVQVAFERCLQEMGFKTFEAWKHDLDSLMEEVLQNHGLERTVMNNHEDHQDSKEFHKQQKLIKETKELESKAENARQSFETVKAEVSSIEDRKNSLQGEIDNLEASKDRVVEKGREAIRIVKKYSPQIKELQEQRKELERELPALRAQISEAKTELDATKKAASSLQAELHGQFPASSVKMRLDQAREEIKEKRRVSRLEKYVAAFERFLERTPIAKGLWHKFLDDERKQQAAEKSGQKRSERDR